MQIKGAHISIFFGQHSFCWIQISIEHILRNSIYTNRFGSKFNSSFSQTFVFILKRCLMLVDSIRVVLRYLKYIKRKCQFSIAYTERFIKKRLWSFGQYTSRNASIETNMFAYNGNWFRSLFYLLCVRIDR